jgi:serine/threonine protein kinase
MIGRRLKQYEIETLLGKGGMGVVYRAKDTRLERPVAIKILSPELTANPHRRRRFLLEARSAAAVTHPAIAQVYDVDEADGTTFIAMEYIDGRTIGRLIAEGELDLLAAVEIALQVSEGLAKAHDKGIIHRDIKSDNIMLTREGHAKLLDFGLAKLLDIEADEDEGGAAGVEGKSRTVTVDRTRTLAGAVMGTISYMSPEQARGKPLDRRSDIFSLGVVLYEMVAGELPFRGESQLDTMHSIAFEEARPVTVVRKNLPPQLHQIISRCLRKRPEDRYPDALHLAEDLKRLRRDIESGTRLSLSPVERLRGWVEQLKSWLPLGTKGFYILAAVLILIPIFIFTNIQWGNLISVAFIALVIYRNIRNKKRRMIDNFVKKARMLPEVRAVLFRDDTVTTILDKSPATTYIRITSLVDSVNRRLFIGRPVTSEIKEDLTEAEFQNALKKPGVLYIRENGKGGGSPVKPGEARKDR